MVCVRRYRSEALGMGIGNWRLGSRKMCQL